MGPLGIMRLLQLQLISMESLSATIPLWQLGNQGKSWDLLTMGHLLVLWLLQLQPISMESPSATIPSWQLGNQGKSWDLLTLERLGIMRLLQLQLISGESPSVNDSSSQYFGLYRPGQNTTKTDWLRKLIQKVVRFIYCYNLVQMVPLVLHSQAHFTKLKYSC